MNPPTDLIPYPLNDIEREELAMLMELGVRERDIIGALEWMAGAHRVRDEWGWLRTVLFNRQAQRRIMARDITRDASRTEAVTP